MQLRPRSSPLFVGVVHLLALPSSPVPSTSLNDVLEAAIGDSDTLIAGGVDALILENYGDAPFLKNGVCPFTISAMTVVAQAIRTRFPKTKLGINVLRNDARAAMGIATAVDASFIRVNIHTGAMLTDQGVIEGQARETLSERRRLQSSVLIAADVHVKHAVPLAQQPIEDAARDCYRRGKADALVLTGSGTGKPTEFTDVQRVRAALPDAPIWIGSGLTVETARAWRTQIDGAIVATALHANGDLSAPLDKARVSQMREALHNR